MNYLLEYERKQLLRQERLLRSYPEKPGIDRDIWNLEYMITQIRPGSRSWRSGHIRSLRRAIQVLKLMKEAEADDEKEKA